MVPMPGMFTPRSEHGGTDGLQMVQVEGVFAIPFDGVGVTVVEAMGPVEDLSVKQRIRNGWDGATQGTQRLLTETGDSSTAHRASESASQGLARVGTFFRTKSRELRQKMHEQGIME